MIGAIAEFSLKRHMTAPKAWVIFAAAQSLLGFILYRLIVDFESTAVMPPEPGSIVYGASLEIIQPFFGWCFLVMALLIPLLATHTFHGSHRTHFTAWSSLPISTTAWVLGEFLGLLLLLSISLTGVAVLLWPLLRATFIAPDILLGGWIALLVIGATFISLSLLCGTLTRHAVLSAGMSLLLSLTFVMLPWLADLSGWLQAEKSITQRAYRLLHGQLQLEDIGFYGLCVTVCLLAAIALLSRKRRHCE